MMFIFIKFSKKLLFLVDFVKFVQDFEFKKCIVLHTPIVGIMKRNFPKDIIICL
jgi:hypothetical protein